MPAESCFKLCAYVQGVLQMIASSGSEFNDVNLSTAFVYLAKSTASQGHSQLLMERREFALLMRLMGTLYIIVRLRLLIFVMGHKFDSEKSHLAHEGFVHGKPTTSMPMLHFRKTFLRLIVLLAC